MFEILRSQMSQNGIPYEGEFVIDGQFHNFRIKSKGNKSEWYVADHVRNGVLVVYGSLRHGTSFTFRSWEHGHGEQPTPEELEESRQRYKKALLDRQIEWDQKRKELEAYYNQASTGHHLYLERKKMKGEFKVDGEALLIPLRDVDGNFVSLQKIYPDGSKRNGTDIPATGGTFEYGTKGEITYITEGISDADTVYQATNENTFCSFGSSKVLTLAHSLKEKGYQNIVYIKDNDKAGDAVEAEMEKNGFTVKKGWSSYKDLNELHKAEGLDSVKEEFREHRSSRTVKDWLSLDIEAPKWTVPGLYQEGSIVCLWGPPGCAKSRMAYALSYHFAGASTLLGFTPQKPLKTIIFDGEMSEGEILLILKKTTEDAKASGTRIIPENFQIENFETFEELAGKSLDIMNPTVQKIIYKLSDGKDIVVLDNLANLVLDEQQQISDAPLNSAKTFLLLKKWLDSFKKRKQTVVLIHHTDKDAKAMAGSEAINRLCSLSICIGSGKKQDDLYVGGGWSYRKKRNLSPSQAAPFKWMYDPDGEYISMHKQSVKNLEKQSFWVKY